MEIVMKNVFLACVFTLIQAEKIFVDYNGFVIKVPTKTVIPLDDNVLAQAVMYGTIGFIVVFMMWLSIHDTEKTLLTEYSTNEESFKTRQELPEERPSIRFTATKDRPSGTNTGGDGVPQFVPQLSNWLIFPQLRARLTGVDSPGCQAGMPVELHLPGQEPNKNNKGANKSNLKSATLYGELTPPSFLATMKRGKKRSVLSSIEVGPSCAAKLEPCHIGLLLPNKGSEEIPSKSAPQYRYKPSLVLGAGDTADQQPQRHGVHGLFQVSWIMEEVRGLPFRQPVQMVLSSAALSFVAYKLITKS